MLRNICCECVCVCVGVLRVRVCEARCEAELKRMKLQQLPFGSLAFDRLNEKALPVGRNQLGR